MQYSKEYKNSFIQEFIERYQHDHSLSIRQFGIEKFGKPLCTIYLWLKELDVNHIYKTPKATNYHKKIFNCSNQIVKISNNEIKPDLKDQANISIKFGEASINMGKKYSKEDLLLVLSTIKELQNAN